MQSLSDLARRSLPYSILTKMPEQNIQRAQELGDELLMLINPDLAVRHL
jgi:hypothetical protein